MPPVPKTKPKKPPDYEVKLKIGKTTTTKLHHVDSIETDTGVPNQPPVVDFPANVGDVEVFEAELLDAQGNKFSSEGGVWTRVRVPNVWHAVVIHKWPNGPKGTNGDLTVELLQDFNDPNTPYRFAITGGTDDYQGAYGEIEYVSPQDITFRFSTP
jgi:hypothetical protein